MPNGLGTYVVYLLFLLIPGFASLRAFHSGRVSLDSMTRLDKLAAIVTGGFVSLLLIGVLYRLDPVSIFNLTGNAVQNCFSWTAELFSSGNHPLLDDGFPRAHPTSTVGCPGSLPNYHLSREITYESAKSISLLEGGLAIIAQSLVSGLLGFGYGRFRRNLDDHSESKEELVQPWERAYEFSNIGDHVKIITTQGREIQGEIQQMGSVSEEYDMLLENPKEVIRNSEQNIVDFRSLGEFSYHHYRDISRVEFREEDLYDPEGNVLGADSFSDKASQWKDAGQTLLADLRGTLRIRSEYDVTEAPTDSDETSGEDEDAPDMEFEIENQSENDESNS